MLMDKETFDHLVGDYREEKKELSLFIEFTHNELVQKKEQLKDLCIEIDEVTAEKTAIVNSYKARLKPIIEARANLTEELKQGGKERYQRCVIRVYTELGQTQIFSLDGELLDTRPSTEQELEPVLFKTM